MNIASGENHEASLELDAMRLELEQCRRELMALRSAQQFHEAQSEPIGSSENLFRTIVDTIPGMICTFDPDGQVVLFSPQVLEYFGRSAAELKDWAMTDAVHPDDLPQVIEMWKRSVASGEPFDSEQRQRRADGVYRWQHSRALPTRDENGSITGWYMLITDVDDLRRTADALRRSEQFARGQGDAMRHILDALARESSADRIVEHVLRTITHELGAHSCSVWSKESTTGLLHFAFSLVSGEFHTSTDVRHGASFPSERVREIWPGVDIFDCGEPQIVPDIRQGPDFPWRADLLAQGIISVLVVPMLVGGQVQGIVGIRFGEKRLFQPDEVQLAQTLANQAMLAMQLSRIAAKSREAAVLAERNRLAREIHDTLAQGFTGVIVQLEAADDATSRGLANEAADHVRRAGVFARESLQEARRSVRALRPRALERQDFCEALNQLLRDIAADTRLTTALDVSGTPSLLPAEWEEHLLRICQEVLTNTVRHAGADNFSIELRFGLKEMSLKLWDNGRGFDSTAAHEGFGLIGIGERVQGMNGKLTLDTAKGKGTTISITLPLPADRPLTFA